MWAISSFDIGDIGDSSVGSLEQLERIEEGQIKHFSTDLAGFFHTSVDNLQDLTSDRLAKYLPGNKREPGANFST